MQFTKYFKTCVIISAVVLIAGLAMGMVKGVNFGVDFTGGSLVTIDMGGEFEVDDVTAALEKNDIRDTTVVKSGTNATDKTQAVIRLKPFTDDTAELETQVALLATLQETYPNASLSSVERVGAVASQELIRNCIFAVSIATVLMLVYIWIRFEILSGVAAVLCLLHDVLVMIAVVTILQMQVNSSFIAAVLTIVGYSINNTIVIFDRIRENDKRFGKRWDRETLTNNSIQESLTRSINTSLTTLITIGCVYLFGVDSIKEFALPIIIGLIAGTYSSVFLAAPLWNALHSKAKNGKTGKKKMVARA